MLKFYDLITTPVELLTFMNINFHYGYVDKDNIKHSKFNSDWFDKYVLQTECDMLQSSVGCCFDAVEFERFWFQNYKYEFITIFEMVKLDYPNNYSMHTFLVYKENGFWYYFEWADFNNQGVFRFKSLNEALDYQFNKYKNTLKNLNIKEEELNKIIRKIYLKPLDKYTAEDYLEFVMRGDDFHE